MSSGLFDMDYCPPHPLSLAETSFRLAPLAASPQAHWTIPDSVEHPIRRALLLAPQQGLCQRLPSFWCLACFWLTAAKADGDRVWEGCWATGDSWAYPLPLGPEMYLLRDLDLGLGVGSVD